MRILMVYGSVSQPFNAVFPKLFELADQETMNKNLADQKVDKKISADHYFKFFWIPYSFINKMA